MENQDKKNRFSFISRELITFYLIACTLSWLAMLLWNVPANNLDFDPKVVQDAFTRVSFIYAFGPFLSAVIVTFIFLKHSGLKSLFKNVLKWRINFVWYL